MTKEVMGNTLEEILVAFGLDQALGEQMADRYLERKRNERFLRHEHDFDYHLVMEL